MTGFEAAVSKALTEFVEKNSEGRRIALFDADGTLWRGDVGESFFRHQIERKTVPQAPSRDPWGHYIKEALEGDAAKAYGWLAQWNAGVEEADLVRWCEEYFRDTWTKMVFEPMREFTHMLLNSGFEVWVITGSPRWIVQAGVRGYGIPADRVIGTSVLVKDGVLTDVLEHEVPYRAGKARLYEKIIGSKPIFAAGNTYWDKEMLQLATSLQLAIHSEEKGEPNYDSEQKMYRLAQTNGWLTQRF